MADNNNNNNMYSLNTAAMALQAARMDRLMADMESNLESTTSDIQNEEAAWTQTSRISVANLDDVIDLNEVIYPETSQEVNQNLPDTGNDNNAVSKTADEEKMSDNTNSNDDRSEDDISSSSSSSSSDLSSEQQPISAAASLVDDASSMESGKSFSLLQFYGDNNNTYDNNNSREDSFLAGSLVSAVHEELSLQKGILRMDSSSDNEALICDWDLWRAWKSKELTITNDGDNNSDNDNNELDSSSQRWGNESMQDSSLQLPTLPARRDSSSSTRSHIRKDSVHSQDASDDEFFDWQAWKRRREGQKSSSSRTNSFSMSMSISDDDDDFDVTSVLAKLDEWDDNMEEDSASRQSGSEASNSSESSSDDDDDDDKSTTSGKGSQNDASVSSSGINTPWDVGGSEMSGASTSETKRSITRASLTRGNSEVLNTGKREAMADLRCHSDKGLRYQASPPTKDKRTGDTWKQWQSTQRKRRMSKSWSNIAVNLSSTDLGSTVECEGSHTLKQPDADATTETVNDDSIGDVQDTVESKNQSETVSISSIANNSAVPSAIPSPNPSPPGLLARCNSLRMQSPPSAGSPGRRSPRTARPGRMIRSFSLKMQSPNAKSPIQKSPLKQNMEVWRSWQRDKRRSGIRKSASGRDMWKLPFAGDSNTGKASDTEIGSETALLQSSSERWSQKDDSSLPTNPRQKMQRTQSERLHTPTRDQEIASFDWDAFRKEHKRISQERSKSESWKPAAVEHKSERKAMLRSKSENWKASCDSFSAEPEFDWKHWAKDRRKELKRGVSAKI